MKKILIVFLLTILTGCANVAIKQDQLSEIKSLKIEREVTYVQEAYNNSLGAGLGAAIGGAVGILVIEYADDDRDEMTLIIQEHSKINEVAYDTFVSELSKDPVWGPKLKNNREPDATIKLEVYLYGFDTRNIFAEGAKPAFGIAATMTDKNGSVIWKKVRGLIEYADGLPKYNVEEYLTDVSRYQEACKKLAVKLINTTFLTSMNGK